MSMIKENDVCVLYFNNLPNTFVRIEHIVPDVKPGWYAVSFIELAFPINPMTWKLDEEHLKGATIHMNGKEFCLQLLECQVEKPQPKAKYDGPMGKIISMADFKERRKIKEIPQEVA